MINKASKTKCMIANEVSNIDESQKIHYLQNGQQFIIEQEHYNRQICNIISFIDQKPSADDFMMMVQKFLGCKSMRYQSPENGMKANDWFDCSGFVKSMIELFFQGNNTHINVPRHANEMWDSFGIFVSPECVKKGDLVFFNKKGNDDDGTQYIYHVGIVEAIENGYVHYIHATGKNNTFVKKSTKKLDQPCKDYNPENTSLYDISGFKRIAIPHNLNNGRYRKVLLRHN